MLEPPALIDVLKQKYPSIEQEWIFFLYSGIGDHIYWLSALAEFRKRNGPVNIICHPSIQSLVWLFDGHSYDRCFATDKEFGPFKFVPGELKRGSPILAWHGHYDPPFKELAAVETYKSSIITLIQSIIGLPAQIELAVPIATEEQKASAAMRFNGLGLKQDKTVFIAPYARTSPTMPKWWWLDLIKLFTDNGIGVVCNKSISARGYDLQPVLPGDLDGAVNIEFEIGDVLPFAELCGTVIGPASGIAVLTARSSIKNKHVMHVYHGNPIKNYDKDGVWSLNREFPGCGVNEIDINFMSQIDKSYWMPVIDRISNG